VIGRRGGPDLGRGDRLSRLALAPARLDQLPILLGKIAIFVGLGYGLRPGY
jgi:hypothetical protein